jgi:hypothetical protein
MMDRILSLVAVAILAAGSLAAQAGEYANDVEQLGDEALRSTALERIARGGADAFDDLLVGLRQDPDEPGISSQEAARRQLRRTSCVRLLGAIGDTRASGDILELLRANRAPDSQHPWLAGTCALALGSIWGTKEDSEDRREIVDELAGLAADEEAQTVSRWGALRGLAKLSAGLETAQAVLATDSPVELKSAAIEIMSAAGIGVEGLDLEPLEALWLSFQESEDKTEGAGLAFQALMAAVQLGSEVAVTGLVEVAVKPEYGRFDAIRKQAMRMLAEDPVRDSAITTLVGMFKSEAGAQHRRQVAQAMGEFGAEGVAAFLGISGAEPPEGEPETYYSDLVDNHLTHLGGEDALRAFAAAYRDLGEDLEHLRPKLVQHMLDNRDRLDSDGLGLLREVADDMRLEAPLRAGSIGAYAEMRGLESFDDLARWAESEEPAIRRQAVDQLGRSYIPLVRSEPLLIAALASEGEDFAATRRVALLGLQRSRDREHLPLFLERMDPETEASADVRMAAIQAVNTYRANARIRDDEIFPAIRARLSDESDAVRAESMRVTVVMAQRMGESSLAVELVEQGLNDESVDVRAQAYAQVPNVRGQISAEKIHNAALREESARLRGQAVTAIARLGNFGEGDTRRSIIDLAFRVLRDGTIDRDATMVLTGAGQAGEFNNVSTRARELIDTYADEGTRDYGRIAPLIDVLIGIQDNAYFTRMKELGKLPDVTVRRKAVEYIRQFGDSDDLPWLRELLAMEDRASRGSVDIIEDTISYIEDRG